jgi:hypothetical protein
MADTSQFTYDMATGTLTDSAGKPVDPASLASETPKAPEPTVSDARMKRLLIAALNPHYR